MRIDLIGFGLTAVTGFPLEGMAQNAGKVFLSPEIGPPVPRQEPLDGYPKIVAIRGDGVEKGLWGSVHLLVRRLSPSGLMRQTYRLRACRSILQ